MSEELKTRDVLEQVNARLSNVEQDIRLLRGEMRDLSENLRGEMNDRTQDLRGDMGGLTQSLRGEMSELAQSLRAEMGELAQSLRAEMTGLRSEMATQNRWLVGLMLASWLTLMASIWLKS